MRRIFNRTILLFSVFIVTTTSVWAVDMTVFGFTLGEKLLMPECERKSYGYGYSKTVCYERFSKYVNGKDTYPAGEPVNESIVIKFPYSDSPGIVKGNAISAIVLDGKLEGVSFVTSGLSSADDVLAKLKDKYGKTASYLPRKLQNRMGASYDSFAAGWTFENLDVVFLGVTTTLDEGEVVIDTKKGGAWRKKRLEELTKDKRPI